LHRELARCPEAPLVIELRAVAADGSRSQTANSQFIFAECLPRREALLPFEAVSAQWQVDHPTEA
jgi:hypothetical protein